MTMITHRSTTRCVKVWWEFLFSLLFISQVDILSFIITNIHSKAMTPKGYRKQPETLYSKDDKQVPLLRLGDLLLSSWILDLELIPHKGGKINYSHKISEDLSEHNFPFGYYQTLNLSWYWKCYVKGIQSHNLSLRGVGDLHRS